MNLSSDELSNILCHFRPPEVSPDLYLDYITMLLAVFIAVCRDLRELKHVVRTLYNEENIWCLVLLMLRVTAMKWLLQCLAD